MKSPLTTLLPLLLLPALTPATPVPPAPASADPTRTLPPNWSFNITSLRGPACAPPSSSPPNDRPTRLTYGQNTVDGSEIYYWHVAYPALRVALSGDETQAHTWCETELQYREWKSVVDGEGEEEPEEGEEYRLGLHRNGTRVNAYYGLGEGVRVRWVFGYYEGGFGDEPITDTLTIDGPHEKGAGPDQLNSPVEEDAERYSLPQCGSGKIRLRVDLFVEADEPGRKADVSSSRRPVEETVQFYGTEVGFSYDWTRCGE